MPLSPPNVITVAVAPPAQSADIAKLAATTSSLTALICPSGPHITLELMKAIFPPKARLHG
jgi:hypothetical protein